MLDYERLDVYQCSLEFAAIAFEIQKSVPKGTPELPDQLRRAALSIPLNIAEAAGRHQAKDRAHFHAIARGSATECGAILDLLVRLDLVNPEQMESAKGLLVRIVAMLSRMCR